MSQAPQHPVAPNNPLRNPPPHPRRARARLPTFSGKVSVAVLVACMAASALVVPAAMRLPLWLEMEEVVVVWWVLWSGVLAVLLHSGRKLSDDHQFGGFRSWFKKSKPGDGFDLTGFADIGSVDAEGCLIVLGAIVLIIAAPIVAWILWEVLIPVVGIALYMLIRSMLAHVVNDRHGCEGDVMKSVLWGVTWATAYTAPVALLVWLGHVVLAR